MSWIIVHYTNGKWDRLSTEVYDNINIARLDFEQYKNNKAYNLIHSSFFDCCDIMFDPPEENKNDQEIYYF